MSNDNNAMESEQSAATLTEVPIVPEPDATTAQLLCQTENSQSIPICSVPDHVSPSHDLSSNASNDIPVVD